MRKLLRPLPILLVAGVLGVLLLTRNPNAPVSIVPSAAAAASSAACTFPTEPAATPEKTAWQLFVAANCPANRSQVVWETWIEQSDLYPANGQVAKELLAHPKHRLHGSPLARAVEAQRRARVSSSFPALSATR